MLVTKLTLATLVSSALAINPPSYSGYTLKWDANWSGKAGAPPNPANWNMINGGTVQNDEVEVYTNKAANVAFSGSGTLQIKPQHSGTSATTGWTSGRIESKYLVTPTAGKITRVEGSIRLAGVASSKQQGIWPAFWMLGQSYRTGTKWPACGEVDIMENINGEAYASGAAHCGVDPGGVCNEPSGLVNGRTVSNTGYHVWRVEFDRTESSWQNQKITWYMDGVQFNQITGSKIGSLATWATLCQSPLYIILNVAVGGDWVSCPLLFLFLPTVRSNALLTRSLAWSSQHRHCCWNQQHDGGQLRCPLCVELRKDGSDARRWRLVNRDHVAHMMVTDTHSRGTGIVGRIYVYFAQIEF
jgi:beta-glucanase (GH16 family)